MAAGRAIVGVSGSLGSLEALRRAVTAARVMRCSLVVVLVWGPEVASFNTVDFTVNERSLLQKGYERIDEVFARALGGVPADVEVKREVRASEANAGRVLTWLADREGDLLVLGSTRRGWLFGLRARSVGRYCIRHARCPVLVVPLPEFAKSVGSPSRHVKRLLRSM